MRIAGLLLFMIFLTAPMLHSQNCTADFTYESNGLTFTFTDLSSSSDGTPINSWSWDFGDGTTSSQQNPSHTFPDVEDYNVCLTITTQGGCTSTQFCMEVEVCELTSNIVMGNCDANGNIPLDITISDPFDRAQEIDVFIDGNLVPGSPFDIDDNAPVMLSSEVPGDGLVHTVRAQSLDIGSCMIIDSLNVPDCNSNCFLSSMSVNIANASTHTVNVGDDFFDPSNTSIIVGDIVEWNWIGNGHTTTSDATSGPDTWNSGELNAPATFSHQFQTAGTHNYYCIPHGGPGGVGMSGVIVSNCPGGSNMIDYEISFSTSQANAAGFNLYIDGSLEAGSPYSYSGTGLNSLNIQLPGDGSLKTFMIEDVNDPSCTISRDVQTPDCGAAPSCSLTLTAGQSGACSNNQVPYDITVNDINGGTQFSVQVNGIDVPGSPFTYNTSGSTVLTINLTGNGQAQTISVTDTGDPNCTDNVQVTPPDCSIPCSITNMSITTGQPALHTVNVEDFAFAPSSLSITEGDTVKFVWTGAVDHTSTSDASSGPDSWDSGLLGNGATYIAPILSIGNHPYYCIPHGSPGGVGMSGTISVNPDCTNGMVSASLTFSSSGTGFNGYNIYIDGNPDVGSPYSYDPSGTTTVVISLPGDGMSHSVKIEDVDDPTCNNTLNYTTTDCNQTAPCELTLNTNINGSCDNNNNVPVELTVSNLNSSSSFDVFLDGSLVSGSPFSYNASGTTMLTINVPGNGMAHNIEIKDSGDPTCNDMTTVTTGDCSIPCSITNLQVSTGQPTMHTVEVEDFNFIPSNISIAEGDTVQFLWTGSVDHTSTSDASTGPDSWDSGLLGNGATYIAPILSTGNHPYYCIPHGTPGGVGMSGNITVNPDCNNGMVNANITFSSSGTGNAGFNILVDGAPDPGNPFSYNPSGNNSVIVQIPGDGMSHSIEIQDVNNTSCNSSINFTTTDCNQTAPCEVTMSASVVGGCNNNNVPVELTITNLNSSSTFNLLLDGSTVSGSPFSYHSSGTTVANINIPGDGMSHTIQVIDSGDQSCSDTKTLTTTDCSIPCSITNLQSSSGQAVLHTVEVADFDFIPQNISITQGDTVEFVWTGSVAHTATSDASSGPDSWDSGLLGNGATFKTPVLSAGTHPYYCVPHGAPGGVGMSGNISVNPDCTNGMVSITLSFNASGVGINGYNIFVDGNADPGNPFSYDPSGNNSATILVQGDGLSHNIEVRDVDDPSCNSAISYVTPDCNQTAQCQLTMTASIAGSCTSNNNVPVDLEITNLNSGAQFNLYLDGNLVSGSPFSYNASGTTLMTLQVPGDGSNHNIEAVDIDDNTCTAASMISTPDCLNNSCSNFNLTLTTDEPVSHTVEVQDFTYAPKTLNVTVGDTINFVWTGSVAHTVTSDATSGPDSWDSGLLGQGATYQVIIQTAGSHPYYCVPHGAPGGIGMSGTINASDNCDNGLVNVNIIFESDRTAFDTYNVLVDSAISGNSPYNYSPNGINNISLSIPGDGQNHEIIIQDVQIPSCSISGNISVANCNTPTCALSLTAQNISSCLPTDSFTVDIQINGLQNSTAGYKIFVNNALYSNITYPQPSTPDTILTLQLLGNGTMKNIEVRDVLNSSCIAQDMMQAPACGNLCVLSQLQINSNTPAIHEVEVQDFDYAPHQIQILEGDSVQFVWTGQVEHTVTSDANSGPDSWDSGLLGNGATFTVGPQAIGDHPYYCTPHGGPGGIGMSGNIEVLETCDGDSSLISFSFNAQNASSGYNVFLDGKKINDSLIIYDAPNGYNTAIVKILGDGLTHTLTLQDSLTNFCALSQNFTAPQCGPPCVISNFEVNQGRDITHLIAVRDFDFNPLNKTVEVGETIRFAWTGDIPHSATSDATTGPDSWDSGILGNGATYDIQLQTPGIHPYYCTPHGGPGGIGMAANITATSNCQNGMDKIQISFKVRGGSPMGYNLFVDGNLHPSSPFQYDNPNGLNQEILFIQGDGRSHHITLQDLEISFCAYTQQVPVRDCNTSCLIESLSFDIGVPSYDTVDVADFEFLPKNITVESGDTLIFDFIGDIPHTVTSDATTGSSVFNSGVLGKGAIYKLSLKEEGDHPYYCIPHGGPNGIGMAGKITVLDECGNDSLNVRIDFSISGPSTAYNVYIDDKLWDESPVFYKPGKEQFFHLSLPAEGQLVNLRLEDVQQTDCKISTSIQMPDCDDPCYAYQAGFSENVDGSLLNVVFQNESRFEGNVSYTWDFGDGNTSSETHPTHTYDRVGTYEVCLSVTSDNSNCTDTICKFITVGTISCSGDFTLKNDGLNVSLAGTAQTNNPDARYEWNLGDGNVSTGKAISHQYKELGLYEVCLEITYDTCVVNICKMIDLTDSCLLLQSTFQAIVQEDDRTVVFNNQSNGDYTYRLWGFGDGNTSTDEHPTYTYREAGIYNVCLILRNEVTGCSDYYCFELEVGNVSADQGHKGKEWIIYPNPVQAGTNSIFLQQKFSNEKGNIKSIQMLDAFGRSFLNITNEQIIYTDMFSIDLRNTLLPGVYYIRIFDGSVYEVHKLIIQ